MALLGVASSITNSGDKVVRTEKPCVFLDRDGVIVVPEFRNGRSYAPKTLENFGYFPETQEALLCLKAAGYLLIVVTNQPDVGNGVTPLALVEAMHDKIRRELPIDHIEACYHAQQDDCHCRKPKPGMLLNATKKFTINLKQSFMVGDRSSDVEAGKQLDLTTIFIDHCYQEPVTVTPDYICKSLSCGVKVILERGTEVC